MHGIIQMNEEILDVAQPFFGLAHSKFENFAPANPSKVAIRSSTGSNLSYVELNAKANSFAHWLVQQGVQYGQIIPLYMV